MPTKVLLDTDVDIGGDIDDLLCLAYLLAQPACELVGVTTVSWDTQQRAMIASALCTAAGRRVPIYPGARTPLLMPLPVIQSHHDSDLEQRILERWEHQRWFPQGQAVEFMRQAIRASPGEIVLLAIGPLTNVALLFAVDPDIPRLLKGLVIMGGLFQQPTGASGSEREWNALVDPHATAMVYRASVGVHRSIGLDVTRQVTLEAATIRARLQARRLPALNDMVEAWFSTADRVTFHDPLAAATIFDDQICRFMPGTVDVELTAEQALGVTRWREGAHDPRHEVALQVKRERFFNHYFNVLAGADW